MITVDTKLGYANVDFTKDNENFMLLTVTGKELSTETKRPPISIVALLDISSSMSPEYKIGYLKKSVAKLIDNLAATDRLSLIAYSTNAQVLLHLTEMTPDAKKKALDIVGKLYVQSMTNISEAVTLGFEEFKGKLDKEGINRIILFTDGCPTAGNTNFDALINLSDKCPDGVQLTAMGYGKPQEPNGSSSQFNGMGGELNVLLLEKMSEKGKGNYYYMSDPDTCGRAFASELAGLLTVVAQKVKITISPEKNRMKILEVMDDVDVEDEDGRAIITIPDVMAGETRYILLKVETEKQDKAWARPATVANISTEFTNVIEGKIETLTAVAKINFAKKADTEMDSDVATQLGVIKAIKAQEEADKLASLGNFVGAQAVMNDASSFLNSTGTVRGMALGATLNSTATSYYVNNATFTSSANVRHSNAKGLKSGRASGSDYDSLNSTSAQKSFQDTWNVPVDTNTNITVDTTVNVTKTLKKSSSNNRW